MLEEAMDWPSSKNGDLMSIQGKKSRKLMAWPAKACDTEAY